MAVTNPQLFEKFISSTVNRVEMGHDIATLSLYDPKSIGMDELPSLVYDLAFPYVFNFLKRCQDKSFHQVLSSVGGDLVTPSRWIKVLVFYVKSLDDHSCWLQIAESIGPLVSCMCNDTERLFFKSNSHWLDGIYAFAALILHLICKRGNKLITEAILQHDGLLESIIQWGYWDSGRPDIVKELGADACAHVVSIGRYAIRVLVENTVSGSMQKIDNHWVYVKDKNLLDMIGTTPILSKAYDPKCMISFVVGLIRDLKTKKEEWEFIPYILQPLMEEVDGIDKDVIMEMIDLGMNHVHDYAGAVVVARLSGFMLMAELNAEEGIESDTRIAFAIRSGLVEMCLNFIDCFGGHEAFGNDVEGAKNSLFDLIREIFDVVYCASLHKKTWKAIRHKIVDIGGKLIHSKAIAHNVISVEVEELLEMVVSILDMNGSYCCRCNKSLSRTEVKLCNGCGCMTYCSRSCQREDWFNGHKLTCCISYTEEGAGQFQGRVLPETLPVCPRIAAKFKDLEINMNMIQLKLLLDNSETILSQAKALDIHLSDCVVSLDLRYCPPTIGVKKYTHWFDTPEEKRGFEETRSKENITCIYFSHIFFNRESDEDDGTIPVFQIQKLYPLKWLTKQSKSVISKPREGSAASPAAVDSLSEHKRLHNIQMNKARWFPRSYGGYF